MFFEKTTDKRSQFTWRLKGRNGKIIASGQSYTRKAACDKAIWLVQQSHDVNAKDVE